MFNFVYTHVGNGQATLEGPIEEVARTEAQAAENLIRELGIQVRYLILLVSVCYMLVVFMDFLMSIHWFHTFLQGPFSAQHSPRGIFCSRTLNLRSISAIGYDMDYTLMHYNVMVSSSFLIYNSKRYTST